MTTTIISENIQSLMKRKEVNLEIAHSKKATPKKEEVVKSVADAIKADESLISVKEILNDFGSNIAKVKVYVYEDKKSKDSIEKINKKKIIQAEIKATHEAKKKAMEAAAKEAEAAKEEVVPEQA